MLASALSACQADHVAGPNPLVSIENLADPTRGTKRKFDFDQDEVDIATREAEEAALRQIEKEQAESRRAKLPAFWLPSLTPESSVGPLKDIKLQTLCHASSPAHVLTFVGCAVSTRVCVVRR